MALAQIASSRYTTASWYLTLPPSGNVAAVVYEWKENMSKKKKEQFYGLIRLTELYKWGACCISWEASYIVFVRPSETWLTIMTRFLSDPFKFSV